jgi:hypothetical protein
MPRELITPLICQYINEQLKKPIAEDEITEIAAETDDDGVFLSLCVEIDTDE